MQLYDTDLAEERRSATFKDGGVLFSERWNGAVRVSELTVTTEKGASAIGRDVGRYLTASFPSPTLLPRAVRAVLEEELAHSLRTLLPVRLKKLLILGLGNRFLTADSIGVRTAEKTESAIADAEECDMPRVTVFVPGTYGQTGMETQEIARAAVSVSQADAVLLLDALAARDKSRLLSAVELCNTGIAPGTGVGNRREPLTEQTLGVPTVAVGIPTVMRAGAFLGAALEKRDNGGEKTLLRCADGLFVVPSGLDYGVEVLSDVISHAIVRYLIYKERGGKREA